MLSISWYMSDCHDTIRLGVANYSLIKGKLEPRHSSRELACLARMPRMIRREVCFFAHDQE
jgi:hypothetical protein